MANRRYSGSIIYEILIVLLTLLLIAVITVPDKIWKEEEFLTKTCRTNLNTIFEAERYHYRQTQTYVDSLPALVAFIANDSTLQSKKRIFDLSQELVRALDAILNVPALSQLVPITKSLHEISSDLEFNERYFRKYEDIMQEKDDLLSSIGAIDNQVEFPHFIFTKMYVDSLISLREHLNEYTLQNAAQLAQRLVDSLQLHLPQIERPYVKTYWDNLHSRLIDFTNRINKTDIKHVSSVGDRIQKFSARIDKSLQGLFQTDLDASVQMLTQYHVDLNQLYNKFLAPQNFLLSQRYAMLQLGETEELLLSLNESNFTCPDNHEHYIISIDGPHLVVECPNLLDEFHGKIVAASEPLKSINVFEYVHRIDTTLQATKKLMDADRPYFRRKTSLILDVKELMSDMVNFEGVFFYKYAKEIQSFLDTLDNTKRLSYLKPAIEDILNPMDTLAVRIEKRDVSDLEKRLQEIGKKIQKLDSTVAATRFPRSIRRKLHHYYPAYQQVFQVVEEMKSAMNPADAQVLRQTRKTIEKDLLDVLKGRKERVHVIFFKTHINHGFVKDGEKSWEMEAV
ncbi:MAG: hypothetical protein D6715_04295 [Calditrichaeota bacterium]|nr:MAG: hypothetical protein D6715_04295 [Calditrichota bacterium]